MASASGTLNSSMELNPSKDATISATYLYRDISYTIKDLNIHETFHYNAHTFTVFSKYKRLFAVGEYVTSNFNSDKSEEQNSNYQYKDFEEYCGFLGFDFYRGENMRAGLSFNSKNSIYNNSASKSQLSINDFVAYIDGVQPMRGDKGILTRFRGRIGGVYITHVVEPSQRYIYIKQDPKTRDYLFIDANRRDEFWGICTGMDYQDSIAGIFTWKISIYDGLAYPTSKSSLASLMFIWQLGAGVGINVGNTVLIYADWFFSTFETDYNIGEKQKLLHQFNNFRAGATISI